jgi:4-aminobutyrate aminotransferase-like enzyme
MPNALWGKYTTENTGLPDYDSLGHLYAECVADKVKELAAEARPPSVFIAETLSGNAGGVELPKGYLREAYASVRSVGGLCIADEVQVGYGRMGTNFWCFEDQDVVPDLVTSAKAAGNGHPLGLVITSRQIAKEFGADGSFFSSAGGAPASCAVGIAVLDTIKRERLQENALEVGTYLKERLIVLAEKHPTVIGRINGKGLYLGIDIIRIDEHGKKVPGTKVAYALCERLLELGVICHNTGDFSSVLKVKPPLCANKEDADFLVQTLDKTFSLGW